MDNSDKEKFEKMMSEMFGNGYKMNNEEVLTQFLLSDLEYVRQKFLQFQSDILENTVIAEQLYFAVVGFANYCIEIATILNKNYEDFESPEKGELLRKIILNQALKTINKLHDN